MRRQRYTMTRRSRRPKSLLQSFLRYSSSFLISPILVAFFRGTGMKSIGRAHRTETEIATSTLLRIAFEYGQIARAPWNAGIDDHSDQRRDLGVDPNFTNFYGQGCHSPSSPIYFPDAGS